MCCEEPIKGLDEAWWVNVRAGERVTTFQSEQAALDFLAKGIDNVPEELQQTFAMLSFRMEMAER